MDKPVRGKHYDIELTDGAIVSCDEVIDALGLNFRVGSALKYIWRSAREGKPGEPRDRDLAKALNFLARETTGRWFVVPDSDGGAE